MQIVMYTAVNLGFGIFSPLSLPLISQSNAFLLINMCLLGILLSVYRTGRFIKDQASKQSNPKKQFIKFEDGKLIVDLRLH